MKSQLLSAFAADLLSQAMPRRRSPSTTWWSGSIQSSLTSICKSMKVLACALYKLLCQTRATWSLRSSPSRQTSFCSHLWAKNSSSRTMRSHFWSLSRAKTWESLHSARSRSTSCSFRLSSATQRSSLPSYWSMREQTRSTRTCSSFWAKTSKRARMSLLLWTSSLRARMKVIWLPLKEMQDFTSYRMPIKRCQALNWRTAKVQATSLRCWIQNFPSHKPWSQSQCLKTKARPRSKGRHCLSAQARSTCLSKWSITSTCSNL